ncbi:lipopolysaccharide biosynthesis protein [Craurococcus roseus]|uniref:Lipopolysaccharide biosynthesis protein n=2 Tax=Craurococcus roseus TaxID=77585 RepID=A0ABN1F8G2_9PROT
MAWTVLESGGMTAVSLVTLVVFAHQLAPAELGSAALAFSLVSLLTLPVEMLFQDALVQRRDAGTRHFDTAFTVSLGLGVGLCALCWLCADLVGAAVGDPQAAAALGWMSLSLPASGLAGALIARNRREFRFRDLAVCSFAGRFVGGATAVAIALFGGGMWAPVAQQVLAVALPAVLLWAATPERPRFGFGRQEFRDLFGYGLSALGTNAVIMVMPRLFMLQVGVVLGTHAAGYFNLAFRAVDVLRDVATTAIWRVVFPLFSRLGEAPRVLRRAFAGAAETTCAIGFPIFAGLAAVAPEVVAVVFGPKWLEATPVVVALCGVAMIHLVRLYAWAAVSALGRPLYPLPGQFVEAAVVLAWPLLGAASAGVAAAAWVLRSLLAWPVDAWMLRRASGLGIKTQNRGLPSIALVAGAMAGAVVALGAMLPASLPGPVRLAVLVAFGAAVYAALLALARRDVARRLVSMVGSVVFRGR